MKKKTRLLTGIIAGLAFMFVFGMNASFSTNTSGNSFGMSLLSLKVQTADAECGGCDNFPYGDYGRCVDGGNCVWCAELTDPPMPANCD